MEKRRAEWLNAVADRLAHLEERLEGFKVADLAGDEDFITAVLVASQIAMRSHEEEKLDALRNAVVNVAARISVDSTREQIFIRLVGDFAPLHLKLLHLAQDPEGALHESSAPLSSSHGGTEGDLVEAVYPELADARDLYDLAWSDLYRAGLTDKDTMRFGTSGRGPMLKRTTELGDHFIAFVTEPSDSA